MASTHTPLIYTLAVLTAIVLVLLILWVCIRYIKSRRARSQTRDSRLQLEQDAAYAVDHGESHVHLHCAYQPSGAPHGSDSYHGGARSEGVELQSMATKGEEVDRAEIWLKKGASRDNLRRVSEEDVLGTKTVREWDMIGTPTRHGLEGAGRR
ncbi:hypothetical protein E8E12_007851 [Didymella heteroderae]|uniref:Uncharacterized protein n=1 Tax=Didymella heteroderae TaxID=1769908 RepID=A0A9P4WRT5_9PLEO|nr:hypothetical protein E8E12_007851 [Didymella heteroderae]